MSTFDPTILEQTVIEESNATKLDPIPEGDHGPAYIESYAIRKVTMNDQSVVPMLDINWRIDDEELVKAANREGDHVIVRQSIWLDVTDQGTLATGPNKNVQLGRLREAVGLNKAGKPFQFSMLEGRGPCRVYVTQRPDKNNPDDVYNDVKKVVAAS